MRRAHHHRLVLSAIALFLLACGQEAVVRPQTPRAPDVASPAPEMVEIWSAAGQVSPWRGTGIGDHTVFVAVGTRDDEGRYEQRMYAIDRASRRTTSRL